jgi:hypothetical protein
MSLNTKWNFKFIVKPGTINHGSGCVEKLHVLAISSGFAVKFPSIFYLISVRKYSYVMLCTPRKLPRGLRRKFFVFGYLSLELRELSCSETAGTTCPAKRQIQEVYSHQQNDHKNSNLLFQTVICSSSHWKNFIGMSVIISVKLLMGNPHILFGVLL